MAREPVAIDFIGLGMHGGAIDDERGGRLTTRLVRPVPSVLELHHFATTQAMSPEGFRNCTDSRAENAVANRGFARPGLSRLPWANKHAMGMWQVQERSSGIAAGDSDGHPVGQSASPSHHTMSSPTRFEVFAPQLAQQVRKPATMYVDPQQAVRSNVPARTSPIRDEAHANRSDAEPSSVSNPQPSISQSAAFGSPVPFYNQMKLGNVGVGNGVVPQHQQEAAHALARPPATGKLPQSAQLTIFYAGMVNVYDEVPFDKAEAIMLLAGNGRTLSSNYANVPGISYGPAPGRPVSAVPSAGSQPASRAGSPAPQVTKTTSIPSISNRPTPTVELPQARKASLARFLESRKDRVRRGPYTNRNTELALATQEARIRLNRETSPGRIPSSSSRPPTRSRSPPEPGNQPINTSLNANTATNSQPYASTTGAASEPNSPKPPTPPIQRSPSQESPGAVPGGSLNASPAASSPSRGC